MANFRLMTWLNESPSTASVLVNGTEVFNGEVGVAQPIAQQIALCEFAVSSGNVQVLTDSGSIKVGQLLREDTYPVWNNSQTWPQGIICQNGAGPNLYQALQLVPKETELTDAEFWSDLGVGSAVYWSIFDYRENIQIDGSPAAWPDTEPFPGGTPEEPDWSGWYFDVLPGQQITFSIVD